MATRSELRTRLKRRLGLGVLSAVEQERLNEAINSGLSRAETDNIPGLNRWEMTGSVLGRLDLTDGCTLTQHDEAVQCGNGGPHIQNEKVHPRDILVVVGGVVPPDDVPKLLDMGAAAVFGPGTVITSAAQQLIETLRA